MPVSDQARVQNPSQDPGQWSADRKASTTKRHIERVFQILSITLGITPNIIPPLVVIFPQRLDQIIHKEQSVIIPKHIPPHVRLITFNNFLHHPRNSNSRSETSTESVREPRSIIRNNHRRNGRISRGEIRCNAINEGKSTSRITTVPETNIRLAAGPGVRGRSDGKDNVAARGGRDRRMRA